MIKAYVVVNCNGKRISRPFGSMEAAIKFMNRRSKVLALDEFQAAAPFDVIEIMID